MAEDQRITEIEMLKKIHDEIKGMRQETNYELRRIATRLEELNANMK